MDDFAARVLAWYDRSGRHDLPWQVPDPYVRWVAEVMLQQTTVAAAIPYFLRFRSRFPSVEALAQASLDEVLALWAGLGYYARARNLHAAAGLLMSRHSGVFPRSLGELTALPGIGLSTAGAILSFAFEIAAPILDANVRRVLGRYHGLRSEGGPSMRALWAYAALHTPEEAPGRYAQAIMDLGALVCKKTPTCTSCPVAQDCAYEGEDRALSRRPRPERSVVMAMIRNGSADTLLVRRPREGVWGGLWSLPECEAVSDLPMRLEALGIEGQVGVPYATVRHAFTHFVLSITPVPVSLVRERSRVCENDDAMWYNGRDAGPGLPAPVRRLLNR